MTKANLVTGSVFMRGYLRLHGNCLFEYFHASSKSSEVCRKEGTSEMSV